MVWYHFLNLVFGDILDSWITDLLLLFLHPPLCTLPYQMYCEDYWRNGVVLSCWHHQTLCQQPLTSCSDLPGVKFQQVRTCPAKSPTSLLVNIFCTFCVYMHGCGLVLDVKMSNGPIYQFAKVIALWSIETIADLEIHLPGPHQSFELLFHSLPCSFNTGACTFSRP